MKKLVLVALAMLVCSAAFAQFKVAPKIDDMKNFKTLSAKTEFTGEWSHLGQNWTATDINGTAIDLQNDYLNQGMYVVVDFSCTWCGPCWNLHNSGMLEQIDALDDFAVLWVEVDADCGVEEIYGRGNQQQTYGNWTVDAQGNTVSYPIIDLTSVPAQFRDQYYGYVPTLMLITPDGLYMNLSGYYAYNQVAASISNIQAIAANAPTPGCEPACIIGGMDGTRTCVDLTLTAVVSTYDPVTYAWHADGTSATGNGPTFTCNWVNPGTYNVYLTVTNQNGSADATLEVYVSQSPDGLLSYSYGLDPYNAISMQSGSTTWGVMFPATMVQGYTSINHVDLYVGYAGSYTLNVYCGGSDAPGTLVGTMTKDCQNTEAYETFTPDSPIAITTGQNLWITFTSNVTYCASFANGILDVNCDWLLNGSNWIHFSQAGYAANWLIDAYASSSNGIARLSNAEVAIYPNPATSVVNVKAEGLQQVEVIDVNGRVVMTVKANTVDMSSLSNGMYIFRVLTNNGVSMQKVVKK